jgi:hypothetical protein
MQISELAAQLGLSFLTPRGVCLASKLVDRSPQAAALLAGQAHDVIDHDTRHNLARASAAEPRLGSIDPKALVAHDTPGGRPELLHNVDVVT